MDLRSLNPAGADPSAPQAAGHGADVRVPGPGPSHERPVILASLALPEEQMHRATAPVELEPTVLHVQHGRTCQRIERGHGPVPTWAHIVPSIFSTTLGRDAERTGRSRQEKAGRTMAASGSGMLAIGPRPSCWERGPMSPGLRSSAGLVPGGSACPQPVHSGC